MQPTMHDFPGHSPDAEHEGALPLEPLDAATIPSVDEVGVVSAYPEEAEVSVASEIASPGEHDHSRLLNSFDTIVRLHQRAEEIRYQLGLIDNVLLTARTVSGLAENLIPSLQEGLDLVAVRLLIREGNPIASALRLNEPQGVEIVLDDFMKDEGQFGSDPFILDEPGGELASMLFGDAAPLIASAAVAYLGRRNRDLGILCLGSDDPDRYCGILNTDVIAEVAHKITLGLYNAWDHESAVLRAIDGQTPDVYSDPFFQAYLSKEFSRAWRNHSSFSLMAISVDAPNSDPTAAEEFLVNLLKKSLRSSDLVAQGQPDQFWALLPETKAEQARCAAQRLASEASKLSRGNMDLRIGIAEFSRSVPTQSALLREALSALKLSADTGEAIVIGPAATTEQ
jgi:uncharacterized protein YigA (DUF484 family)